MIDTNVLTHEDVARISPLPGRAIIQLDAPDTMYNSLIHLPGTAQKKSDKDVLWTGTVLKITPRNEHHPDYQPEEVEAGDRVLVALMLDDVGKEITITLNTRIWAELPTYQFS